MTLDNELGAAFAVFQLVGRVVAGMVELARLFQGQGRFVTPRQLKLYKDQFHRHFLPPTPTPAGDRETNAVQEIERIARGPSGRR